MVSIHMFCGMSSILVLTEIFFCMLEVSQPNMARHSFHIIYHREGVWVPCHIYSAYTGGMKEQIVGGKGLKGR